jgi:predicted AAA+ superfamily ATPase
MFGSFKYQSLYESLSADMKLICHFYQIRGTPSCGKSTLRNLLHTFLKERNALVYTIEGWTTDKHYMQKLHEVCGEFDSTCPTYLLFDEAQETYHDLQLWDSFFKSVKTMPNMHVALFCSYGSASSRLIDSSYGAPDKSDEYQRLSLFPTAQTPLGLHLSYPEFEDLLIRYPHQLSLVDDVKMEILAWSAGHIGAIQYLLDSI